MKIVSKLFLVTALAAAAGSGFESTRAIAAQAVQAEFGVGVQVLTRGPVHEAFAATVTFDPEPGIVVAKPPPEPIEELPPEQRPEGANVAWIPGYFAWDDEQDEYLWISGVWRALPPGRQWVSGYWTRSGHGFQWIGGYWADANVSEIEYLPEPPETIEAGPNIEAPSADYTWIPGSWVWHQGRYAWRPGYWVQAYPDWVWVPGHHVWSPRGYVYVDGYWDYTIVNRGVLFAPVRLDTSVYARTGFYYSPTTVIDLAVFTDHLFLRPRYNHYYFGDYYSAGYVDAGFYPWFSFHYGRYGYDPIYAHERWHHRQDRDWERQVESRFRYRREHEDARPPRTLSAQLVLSADAMRSKEHNLVIATSIDRLAKKSDSAIRYRSVDMEERQRIAKGRQAIQKSREEREKIEAKAPDLLAEPRSRESAPVKVKLPKSPIMATPGSDVEKRRSPPKSQDAPTPDLKVEPKPRKVGTKREPPVREAQPAPPKADDDREKRSDSSEKPKGKSKKKSKDDKDDD